MNGDKPELLLAGRTMARERLESLVEERMEQLRRNVIAEFSQRPTYTGRMEGILHAIGPDEGTLFRDDPRTRIKLGG